MALLEGRSGGKTGTSPLCSMWICLSSLAVPVLKISTTAASVSAKESGFKKYSSNNFLTGPKVRLSQGPWPLAMLLNHVPSSTRLLPQHGCVSSLI